MKFQPIHDNILIKEIKEENKFNIPTESLSVKAEVIKTGTHVTDISVGDIVYLSKYCGTPYIDMLIVKPYDIVGKDT